MEGAGREDGRHGGAERPVLSVLYERTNERRRRRRRRSKLNTPQEEGEGLRSLVDEWADE